MLDYLGCKEVLDYQGCKEVLDYQGCKEVLDYQGCKEVLDYQGVAVSKFTSVVKEIDILLKWKLEAMQVHL